jgi:colicin import membrane protein
MSSTLSDNWKYLSGAVLIHALLAALLFGMALSSSHSVVPQLAIRGVMVDRAMLNRLAQQQQSQPATPPAPTPPVEDAQRKQQEAEAEAAKQQELQRQQEQAAQAKAVQEKQLKEKQQQDQLRLETDAKQRAFQEQQRAAEAQKQQALEQQRQAAEAESKRQQQAADQKRLADIQQKQREAEQKRQAETDAKAQASREAELKQQLADEEGRAQAVNSGLLNQYVALLNQRVERNWTKPQSAKSGLECEVKVTQATGGTVLSVAVGRCNGDAAVRQSIESAVYRSSPLPAPPDPRLFDRNLNFIFKPVE